MPEAARWCEKQVVAVGSKAESRLNKAQQWQGEREKYWSVATSDTSL